MEISRRPYDILSTPIACFRNKIRSSWVRFSNFPTLATLKRTINLIPFAGAYRWFSTDRAYIWWLFFSPSIYQIASIRTKSLIFPTIIRVKKVATVLTDFCFREFPHNHIIDTNARKSIEIEERYAEIAARRLAQEVFPFK